MVSLMSRKKQWELRTVDGIFVTGVATDGAAKAAGIEKGRFHYKINNTEINSSSELQEQVASYKPGDKISLTYVRNGKEYTTSLP